MAWRRLLTDEHWAGLLALPSNERGLVGGKWKPRILFRLMGGSASRADLGRLLPRARPQVLTEQLRQLEADGIVVRLDPSDAQIWGPFALTARGHGLCAASGDVAQWAVDDLGGWEPPAAHAK